MAQPQVQPDLLVWILNQFLALNITVQIDGADLLCQPQEALEPELRAAIRQHKPLLVALLGMSVPSVQSPPSLFPLRPHSPTAGAWHRVGAVNALDPSNRRCGTCRYHDIDGAVRASKGRNLYEDGEPDGYCRRVPPMVFRELMDLRPGDDPDDPYREFYVTHSWPETQDDEWCGEWVQMELPPFHCWLCRHSLIDHTIAPVTCRPLILDDVVKREGCQDGHPWQHGPLRCWCYCELPRLEADQKGAAA